MGKLSADEKRKVRKPMLWIGMASIVMTFAGLTSGYVVSRSSLMVDNRWLQFALPDEFYWATACIIASSISMIWVKRSVKKDDNSNLLNGLYISLVLGVAFAILQWQGWQNLIAQGLYFTGPESNTASSWVYIITFIHWLHIISGIIILIVTIYRAKKGAYSANDHYGLDMTSIYWHFLDLLWIYLFLFLAFIR